MTRMLIADDDEGMRLLGRLTAEEVGCRVVGEAVDGEEAIRMACRLRPDVVLMDRYMPELDGIEATARLHAELPETAIVAWTSSDDPETAALFLQAGAVAHLFKGELDRLREVLRGVAAGPEPSPGPALT